MNTVAVTAPTVKSANWALRPSVAFLLGASDAESGAAFAPEMYFTHVADKRNYAFGFEAVSGATVVTSQFTGNSAVAK